ncbi:hypothetical protein Aph01nite_23840 [Acrocarpospora phusangensis]|uniref:Lipoprotein n=1 Tax=Acrocarpospora phusangensis TaxID=1070424 RepID=A0A919Q7W0_9ACTN|nr:hypothetical protein [Acrocarpospora phusangensis]GIH24074.1 hypothetical protein Aph01nite_23840 [Acrocarpospora phusangensis]
MRRRDFLTVCGGVALIGACGSPAAPRKPTTPGQLLYADTKTGISVIDTGTGRTLTNATIAGPKWTNLYTLDGTSLITLDGTTGKEKTRTPTPTAQTARTVSNSGRRILLADPAPTDPYHSPGRTETRFVIADPTGSSPAKTYTLEGNYEPDAFSQDDSYLFVVDYLPPTKPDGYRVRMLNLADGKVSPILTRTKQIVPEGAEEVMRGDGRLGVPSPLGDRLYTLYTHQPDHLHTRDLVAGRSTGVHAFVHVLSLTELWAYCLDLPEPFGNGPADAHTLAVTPSALYVFDTTSGQALRAETPDLTTITTQSIPKSTGPAFATATLDTLHLTSGGNLYSIDPDTLRATRIGSVPADARGLTTGSPGTLWLGVPEGAVHLDANTGEELARVAVPGLVSLRHAQPAV